MLDLDESSVMLFVQEKLQENISPIKKAGLRWNFRCPVCGDSHKSVRKMRGNYYANNNSYYCFNCDHSSSGLWILTSLLGKELAEVKREFFEWCRRTSPTKFQTKETKKIELRPSLRPESFSIPENWIDIPDNIKPVIAIRRIFEAPYCPKNWKLYFNTKTKRIVIPWFDVMGKICYWQERAISGKQTPKYLFPEGLQKPIFGLGSLDIEYQWMFMFEGVFDCIWMKNGVAIGGKSVTNHQESILSPLLFEKVYFLDNQWIDETGREESLKIAKNSPMTKMFIWPKEIKSKDLNSAAMSETERIFVEKLKDGEFVKSRIMNGARAILELST